MTGVLVDGLRWEVRVRGSGHPLLLVHGFTGRGTSWGSHAHALARAFRLITVDLPGHGRSGAGPPARMTVERTADDLGAILARLQAVPAHVVGYSLGARVALRLAVDHPDAVDRLVLESPSAGLPSEAERAARRAADEALAARIESEGIERFVDEWERNPVFAGARSADPDRVARVRAMRLGNDPAGLAASLRHAGQGTMTPLFDALPTIAVPTLVIAGHLDAIGLPRAERVAALIPDARLAVVDGAGHTPHDERPEAFRRLVRAFLEEEPTR